MRYLIKSIYENVAVISSMLHFLRPQFLAASVHVKVIPISSLTLQITCKIVQHRVFYMCMLQRNTYSLHIHTHGCGNISSISPFYCDMRRKVKHLVADISRQQGGLIFKGLTSHSTSRNARNRSSSQAAQYPKEITPKLYRCETLNSRNIGFRYV
jgi:hypothetical protein